MRAYIDTQAAIAVCWVCGSALILEHSGAGRGWSLGRLLSFSWDPAAKAQAGQQLDHNAPSRCPLFLSLLPFSLSCLPSGYGLCPFLSPLPFALCPLDLCGLLCPVTCAATAGFSLTSIRVCYLPFLPSPCLRWFPLPSCPQPLLVTVLPAVCLSPACAYPSLCIPGCSLLCSVTSQFSIVWWCKGTCAAAKHHAIDKDIDMS